MPTIRDVAKLTGLSVGTVSNVLNNVPTVSEKNREKVYAAIAQLGYRKNQAASQLRSNRSNAIGLIIPDITNPFYPEIARGVGDAARRSGYNVFLFNKDRSVQEEKEALNALLEKQVDGILLFKPHLSAKRARELQKQCALVLCDADPETLGCDTVNVDDYQGMRTALEQVIAMGHRRIAFLSGLPDSVSSMRRLKAYRDVLADHGLPQPEDYVRSGDYTVESGQKALPALMALPEPPTAIAAANDLMAVGVVSQAAEMGLHIPGDLSVVGYDDVSAARWISPRLTTTWHPKYEMGEAAVRLLLDRIRARQQGKELPRQSLSMETELRIRDTLAPPRET